MYNKDLKHAMHTNSRLDSVICIGIIFYPTFYPTALNGCWGIVFTHGVRMVGRAGGRAAENSLSGLYLRNRKV